MPLTDPVPSAAFDVLERNSQDFDSVLNSDDTTVVTTRTGKQIPSVDKAITDAATTALNTLGGLNIRGLWVTATAYAVRDLWQHTVTGDWYIVLTAYTSGANEAADIASGNVVLYQGTPLGVFGNVTIENNEIRATNNGGLLSYRGTNSSAVEVDMMVGNPDAGLACHYANVKRTETGISGTFILFSNTNTDAEVRRIDFSHQDGTVRGDVGYSGSDRFIVRNSINGGSMAFAVSTTGGIERVFAEADADSNLLLRHPATGGVSLRTQDPTIDDNTSAALVADAVGNERDVGFMLEPEFRDDDAFTLRRDRTGYFLINSNPVTQVWTAPQSSTIPNGASWPVQVLDADLTLTPAAGVTLRRLTSSGWVSGSASITIPQGLAYVRKVNPSFYDVWRIGDFLA